MANSHLPEKGFVRLWQIIGEPKTDPPCPAVILVSKSTWWQGVKTGRFPQPVKLGPRTTAWRVEDILALIENPESGQKPKELEMRKRRLTCRIDP